MVHCRPSHASTSSSVPFSRGAISLGILAVHINNLRHLRGSGNTNNLISCLMIFNQKQAWLTTVIQKVAGFSFYLPSFIPPKPLNLTFTYDGPFLSKAQTKPLPIQATEGRDGRDEQCQACWKYPAGWVEIQLLLLLMCFQVTELLCKESLHHLNFYEVVLISPNCWFTLPETWRVVVRCFFSPCHPLNRDVMHSLKTPCISSYIIIQNGKIGNLVGRYG